jgi:hypothetical protein
MVTIGVVSPESSIVLVAIEVATVAFEVSHMLVRTSIPTTLRRVMLLVKGLSVVPAIAEFPLAVLFLPDVVV